MDLGVIFMLGLIFIGLVAIGLADDYARSIDRGWTPVVYYIRDFYRRIMNAVLRRK